MQLDHHSCLIGNHQFLRSEVQPSRRCMSHSMHPQCCNWVFHLLGRFSGNPNLAVFSNSIGHKRVFHYPSLPVIPPEFGVLGMFLGSKYLQPQGVKGSLWLEKVTLLLASFSPQKCNETSNLQIKSSHCCHVPRSGKSRRSWDLLCLMHLGRTRTSQD